MLVRKLAPVCKLSIASISIIGFFCFMLINFLFESLGDYIYRLSEIRYFFKSSQHIVITKIDIWKTKTKGIQDYIQWKLS